MFPILITLLILSLVTLVPSLQPNPPFWPSNVYVFDPSNPSYTQSVVNRVFSENGGDNPPFNGQFSNDRYAFLFIPGNHNVNVNLGFYTSVIGLGETPPNTIISSVTVQNGDLNYQGGALDNFWRSAENYQTDYTMWAVSQACPMRRVLVKGNLDIYQYNSGCCAGYASGGFLADSIITGQVDSGSQQQWFTRNSQMTNWNGGVWNMVFVGCTGGVPYTHCGNSGGDPYTTVPQVPVIAEKPYIVMRSDRSYAIYVPRVEYNKVGPTTNYGNVDQIDFEDVFVANATTPVSVINSMLQDGYHLVLTPGNYLLSDPIVVDISDTVILGIGFPTLISTNGKPVVVVGNVDGVRLSGVLMQGGSSAHIPVLLQWGNQGYAGSADDPSFMYDVFARVGGPNSQSNYQVSVGVVLQINSGNVVVDNTWLWRADHDVNGLVYNGNNPSLNGLVVNGDNVTIYALAVEHHLNDLVVWNGDSGSTYFYQAELPYDVTQANFGNPGYVGYRVSQNVNNHQLWGGGVYSYFRDNTVTTPNGFASPSGSGIKFINPLTRFLNGNGQITNVWNGKGDTVNAGHPLSYIC